MRINIIYFEKDERISKAIDIINNPNINLIHVDDLNLEDEFYIEKYKELRIGKKDYEQALINALLPQYKAAIALKTIPEMHAVIGGIATKSDSVLLAAFRIVKQSSTSSIISSVKYLYSQDGKINIYLSDPQLPIAENNYEQVLINLRDFIKAQGHVPTISLLSASTLGSINNEYTKFIRGIAEKYDGVYGEMQFDAAINKSVRFKKGIDFSGSFNGYVFPSLDSANIGIKIMQEFSGLMQAGPFLVGIEKPMNNLSRGATPEAIAKTIEMTAEQVANKIENSVVVDSRFKSTFHLHTNFCKHSDLTIIDQINQARKFNLTHIGISEHAFDFGKNENSISSIEEYNDYICQMSNAKQSTKDIDISTGLEVEVISETNGELIAEEIKMYDQDPNIDYIILGCHYFDTDKHVSNHKMLKAEAQNYLLQIDKALSLSKKVKYIAHPQIFLKKHTEWDETSLLLSNGIITLAKKYNLPLEININELGKTSSTSPLLKQFWKFVKAANVKVVVGLDAHDAKIWNPVFINKAYALIDEFNLEVDND